MANVPAAPVPRQPRPPKPTTPRPPGDTAGGKGGARTRGGRSLPATPRRGRGR
jgi:hypothetical protein